MKSRLIVLMLTLSQLATGQQLSMPTLKFEGLRIWVDDLDAAQEFYSNLLGFELSPEQPLVGSIKLKTRSMALYLSRAKEKNQANYERHIRTGLTLQVSQLLPAIDQLRKAGVIFEEHHLQRNGVGISIPFRDPAGNLLSLMEVQIREVPPFEGYRIYNSGITTHDMPKAISFYEEVLGFEEWSRDYLPQALPLKHSDGSFAFMLHQRPGLSARRPEYGKGSDLNLIFSTPDLTQARRYLSSKQLELLKAIGSNGLVVKDPFGNFCELVQK